jgi:hypothetical protein
MLGRLLRAIVCAALLCAPLPALAAPSSMARPANTTTYTANTGWCLLASACISYFTFAQACPRDAQRVQVYDVEIWSSANPTVKLAGVLWLFNKPPATIISDDATFNIASADFANITGRAMGIPFALLNSQASGAANSSVSLTGATPGFYGPIGVQCAQGATSLYGMVQVVNAYVPASAEVLTINIFTQAVN